MSMAMCPICMMDVGHNSDECMCNCHDAGYGVIIELLSDSYTDEGIDIWLRARNRNLNMRRPIDLIVEGQIDTVIDEAKWVAGGM